MKPPAPEVGFADPLLGAQQDLKCVAGAFVCGADGERFILTSAFAIAAARDPLVFARSVAIGEVVRPEFSERMPAHGAIGLIRLNRATQVDPVLPWGQIAPDVTADPALLLGAGVRVFGEPVATGKIIATTSVCRVKHADGKCTTFVDTVEAHFEMRRNHSAGELVMTHDGVTVGILVAYLGGEYLVAPLRPFLEERALKPMAFPSVGWLGLRERMQEERTRLEQEPKLDLGPPRVRRTG
jgi:hypothetical protein